MANSNYVGPKAAKLEKELEYTGKKLRIGIVGIGNIATVHLEAYKKVPQAEIVAACDIDEDRLNLACDANGIEKRYTSIEEMVANEELDAIDVCVWNCNHAKCAIYGLEHGLHVLCEKPMAYNAEQALEMQKAAEKSGKLLMIGFVMRFAEKTKVALELVENGMMGDIYLAKATYMRRHGCPGGWFCDKERSGGGPVIDLGVHVIDQIRYIMGGPKPISVYAATSSAIGTRPELVNKFGYSSGNKFDRGIADCEDSGVALIRYDNGAVTLLETSFDIHDSGDAAKNGTIVYGTKGGLEMRGPEATLYTTVNNRLADISIVPPDEDMFAQQFINEMQHFVDCALNGKKCIAPPEDGVWVMKILDAIYESAKTGHEVIIK